MAIVQKAYHGNILYSPMCVTGMGSPIENNIVRRSEEYFSRGIFLELVCISLQEKNHQQENSIPCCYV
jgi:hypothetical protein